MARNEAMRVMKTSAAAASRETGRSGSAGRDVPAWGCRAFTLIELLVVILIIGLVVAIVFPALSGARNASRKAATTSLMTRLGTAVDQFYTDHSRMPGYFAQSEMGTVENRNRGFTNMKNLMLELAGGLTEAAVNNGNNDPCDEIGGPRIVEVGPVAGRLVKVNLGQIFSPGQGQKAYVQMDKRDFVRQCEPNALDTNEIGHRALPEVVDAWGTPILAWIQDEVAPGAATQFSLETVTNTTRARYYWASNAAVLGATSTGKLKRDQATMSLIGSGTPTANAVDSLKGLLGHPAYPRPGSTTEPAVGRAAVVFHAAGADGYFLGRDDLGGRRALADQQTPGIVAYNPTPAAAPGSGPLERQRDPIDGFDDLLITAGSNR